MLLGVPNRSLPHSSLFCLFAFTVFDLQHCPPLKHPTFLLRRCWGCDAGEPEASVPEHLARGAGLAQGTQSRLRSSRPGVMATHRTAPCAAQDSEVTSVLGRLL